MINAVSWFKQFADKNHGKVCRAYLKETVAHDIAIGSRIVPRLPIGLCKAK